MEHGGHDVSILSFEEAYSDSNIFVGDLYEALYESNINAFKDVGSSEWSEDSGPIALRAIKESRISVIVFSESDAYSEWCLDAVVMILDCVQTKGKLVLPVFYNVDPSEVSHQTGIFGLAMAELEDKLQDNMEKVEKWRLALSEAAHRLGWSLEKGEEIDVIPNIVEEVSNHLRFEHLTRSEE
ncbi:disease resistance protein RUN1-like isoform X2 [Prosopis cineraria]|uniref:disease resistance protein RUN1-like isoform X2 n=1 Tax=Prosopis cineraria TaxID=364024 RepID=UPI00240F251C|nr:disease resistance protein RUN1-like isoform X2 [Prosopis cineraria]XP_054790321.1 disease resistance protein RUN1-like isoform X2 [Prosopis cineraria]XP_054790322.1 disease resistance protein RUN1-like isoform X2 [Prosopis cineraria]